MATLLFKFGSALRAPVGQQGCALQGGASEIKKNKNWFTTLHLTLIQKLDLFTTNINV